MVHKTVFCALKAEIAALFLHNLGNVLENQVSLNSILQNIFFRLNTHLKAQWEKSRRGIFIHFPRFFKNDHLINQIVLIFCLAFVSHFRLKLGAPWDIFFRMHSLPHQ